VGISVRLFVALDIPEDVRAALRAFVAPLRQVAPAARWTRTEGQHVTLKFLGNVGEEKLEAIRSVLSPLRSPEPVRTIFRGANFFPNARRPRVFWAGVESSENLAMLAADVEGAMVAAGFAPEQRPFRPHLTLARFPEAKSSAPLLQALENRKDGEPDFGAASASEFFLYQSHLKPTGAEYTRLEVFPFVEKLPEKSPEKSK
jgi:2'-5' RNA ligase